MDMTKLLLLVSVFDLATSRCLGASEHNNRIKSIDGEVLTMDGYIQTEGSSPGPWKCRPAAEKLAREMQGTKVEVEGVTYTVTDDVLGHGLQGMAIKATSDHGGTSIALKKKFPTELIGAKKAEDPVKTVGSPAEYPKEYFIQCALEDCGVVKDKDGKHLMAFELLPPEGWWGATYNNLQYYGPHAVVSKFPELKYDPQWVTKMAYVIKTLGDAHRILGEKKLVPYSDAGPSQFIVYTNGKEVRMKIADLDKIKSKSEISSWTVDDYVHYSLKYSCPQPIMQKALEHHEEEKKECLKMLNPSAEILEESKKYIIDTLSKMNEKSSPRDPESASIYL